MNPRYLAYCHAHGNSPTAQMKADENEWPGGIMCGFILWIQERWLEFEESHKVCAVKLRNDLDRAMFRMLNTEAFDIWLQHRAEELNRLRH